MLKREFKFYRENQDKLVSKYKDKFIVIKNDKVIGVFEDELTAYIKTKKKHNLGTFLIQFFQPGKENYTQTFHSLAIF